MQRLSSVMAQLSSSGEKITAVVEKTLSASLIENGVKTAGEVVESLSKIDSDTQELSSLLGGTATHGGVREGRDILGLDIDEAL